jgi:hypothetical protein
VSRSYSLSPCLLKFGMVIVRDSAFVPVYMNSPKNVYLSNVWLRRSVLPLVIIRLQTASPGLRGLHPRARPDIRQHPRAGSEFVVRGCTYDQIKPLRRASRGRAYASSLRLTRFSHSTEPRRMLRSEGPEPYRASEYYAAPSKVSIYWSFGHVTTCYALSFRNDLCGHSARANA